MFGEPVIVGAESIRHPSLEALQCSRGGEVRRALPSTSVSLRQQTAKVSILPLECEPTCTNRYQSDIS